MTFLRIKRFMKSLVTPQEEVITTLNTKAVFTPSPELERRIQAAREAMGLEEPKLIEDQPDTFQPVDYDRLPP